MSRILLKSVRYASVLTNTSKKRFFPLSLRSNADTYNEHSNDPDMKININESINEGISKNIDTSNEIIVEQYISDNDIKLQNEISMEIVSLLIKNSINSDLTLDIHRNRLNLQRLFKTTWLKHDFNDNERQFLTNINQNINKDEDELDEIVSKLTYFKYVNKTPLIAKFFKHKIIFNDKLIIKKINIFNNLIDFYSANSKREILLLIFRKMDDCNIMPNSMTYNLLGKNYLSKSNLIIERLQIWLLILKRMELENINYDLSTFYLSLSILPILPAKKNLKDFMIMKKINLNPLFTSMEINDLINSNYSSKKIANFFFKSDFKDVNSLNSTIFSYLTENKFNKAWKLLISRSHSIKPKNSTLTIFLSYCQRKNNIELMIRILNTFRFRYSLYNFNSNRLVINHCLKINNNQLTPWYPLILKYLINFSFGSNSGIDNYRRLDILKNQLQFKLNSCFKRSANSDLLNTNLFLPTPFEKLFFQNLSNLFIINSKKLRKNETDFLILNDSDINNGIHNDVSGNGLIFDDFSQLDSRNNLIIGDTWILNTLRKSYFDWIINLWCR